MFNILKLFIFGFISFTSSIYSIENKNQINICTDENPHIPLGYEKDGKLIGIKYDIMNEVIKKLKIEHNQLTLKIEPTPWSRCLNEVRNGTYDAALFASFSKERAEYISYPDGAATEQVPCTTSKSRIACAGYDIYTAKKKKFVYTGDLQTLPTPIFIARGYSIIDELKAVSKNIIIEEVKNEQGAIKRLATDEEGSAIVSIWTSNEVQFQNSYQNQIELQKKPFNRKSYFLGFSKKTKIDNNTKDKIWSILEDINNDENFKKEMYKKYEE